MARLVSTNIIQDLFGIIQTTHVDGSVDEKEIRVGDLVENLRYVDDHEIKTITGKIVSFTINIKRFARVTTASARYQENTFSNDVELTKITVDCSDEYESNLVTINAKEIVEDDGVEDVVSVHTILKLNARVKYLYADNTTSEIILVPGNLISNVVIKSASSGKPNTEGTYKLSKFIYVKDNNTTTGLRITSFVLIDPDSVFAIPVERIISMGGVIEVTEDTSEIANAITGDDIGVAIGAVEYSDAISITKEFTIAGAKYGVPANTGARATGNDITGESVLSGAITVGKDADLTIDGVTLTGSAQIKTTDSSRVVLRNCRFVGIKTTDTRGFLVQGFLGDGNPVKVEIENCYFGDVDSDASGAIYNLFELTCKLADGSYIRNNRFSKAQCTHNSINVYDVEDAATISIENNTFEYSANAIRVGIKGEPTCTVNINRNTYLTTDSEHPEYAGLLLIQPYGKATTSFANCTISLKSNINRSGISQVYYSYSGKNDMQFTEYNIPTIIFNGKTMQAPKELSAPAEPEE